MVKTVSEQCPTIKPCISHTTRAQRPGEQEGKDYFFVAPGEFATMVEAGEFLEHAVVFGASYGTSHQAVAAVRDQGCDVILEIDWQGARSIRAHSTDAVSIFVLPPSLKALRGRLEGRGKDSADAIEGRMNEALAEMSHVHEYDYVIVNDQFDDACAALRSIIEVHALRTATFLARHGEHLADLITGQK